MLDTNKTTIGLKIRKYRKDKRLTQFQLAELVGINEKQISRIESGTNYPTYPTFAKLIDALEIDISDFFIDKQTKTNQFQEELIRTIRTSEDYELNLYNEIIKTIQKNIKTFPYYQSK